MAFVPRLSAPSSTDKLWIQSRSGGYNPCIPIYGGPSVLPNCFTGDTKIVTKQGIVRLDSIVDQEVEVLSKDGLYRKAKGHCYGVQPLFKIWFANGQGYRCTANHRWVVFSVCGYHFKTTIELTEYDMIPYVGGKGSDGKHFTNPISIEELDYSDKVYCVEEPETHTMTLDCGILTGQCVGYAYGRFMEALGATTCSLSTADAGQWWYYTQDGYERGQDPRLGAVICWSRAGQAGHVAIVEQINPDGSIVTSNSAYNSTRFYTQTLSPPYYTWSSFYKLQGFIYNPNVDGGVGNKVQGFIEQAKNLVGEKMKKSLSMAVGVSVQMVTTCTKAVSGLSNVVIPIVSTPSALAKRGVEKGMGEFIEGPLFGNERTPQVGDIILLRTSEDRKYEDKTDCDKLAIVCEAKDSTIDAVHVNSSNIVANTTYKTSYRAICGYYRPDWSKVNNSASAAFGYAPLGKYYETENTAEDATIREVGYLSTDYEPTTKKSGIKLSVVNYTTLLASFLDDLLVPSAISGNMGVNVITDALDSKVKITVDFLLSKGLNAAAACGIAGNIYYESNFNTAAIGDYGTSFGICQWHYGRGDNMKRVAGSDWKNNLSGQLNYLWQELQGAYSATVLSVLNTVSNTLSGAQQAADVFVRRFEIPAYVDDESVRRQAKAAEYWNALVIQMTTNSIVSTVMSSDVLSGKEIVVPSSVPQDGISNIYTNYLSIKWMWNQGKIFNMWKQAGSKVNRNIATLNGFYLIAVKPVFGTTGDKVSVILEDGTCINAIIADAKGDDSGSNKYGHDAWGGKINIIEWEVVDGTTNSISSVAADLTGWKGKFVSKIINGGSIL